MDFIISLAHFCETHGPTSILCTQLNPTTCSTCSPQRTPSPSPPAPVEDLTRSSSFASSFFETPGTPTHHDSNALLLYSPLTSPPTSPHSSNSSYNPYFGEYLSSESGRGSFGARSSFSSDFDSDSCDNCSFVVPKDLRERIPDGAPGSPTKTGGRLGTPVLRTTQTITAYTPIEFEEESEEYHEEDEEHTRGRSHCHPDSPQDPYYTERDGSPSFAEASISTDTSLYTSTSTFLPQTHTHDLTYVTTRQPTSPVAYSLLRRSCLRTLSGETLPKSSPKGPLYFGDPVAGYTIAYIFHVKDQRARGQKRTYALIAMGGRDSWRVSTQYVAITRVFERIANAIVSMAEKVTAHETPPPPSSDDGEGETGTTPPLSSSLPLPSSRKEGHAKDPRENKSAANSPTSTSRTPSRLSDVSSFLSAKRVDPDGFARGSRDVMIPRGLDEITGSERIFVDLHKEFVLLVSQLAA